MVGVRNNLWLIVSLSILVVISLILWIVLDYSFCNNKDPLTCAEFKNFNSSIIEIAVGIGIVLIIHDHARKIQNKENNDLNLTIQGTYYHLWSLHETLRSYIISDKVRSEYSSSVHILNLLSQSQANISKCGRKLNPKILNNLQLHLILIQKTISVSIDPRGNVEEYWTTNSQNVQTAFNSVKKITISNFEPYVKEKYRMTWAELS